MAGALGPRLLPNAHSIHEGRNLFVIAVSKYTGT